MPVLPATITSTEFGEFLGHYEETLAVESSLQSLPGANDTLVNLDTWRREVLPSIVSMRAVPHLTKSELVKILQCKLKRGKNRPTLPALVASNTDAQVIKATSTGISAQSSNVSKDRVLDALKQVSTLRGVGPATASYVLAAFLPNEIPIFSDEGFRWIMFQESQKGKGWDRKIQYTLKEYGTYLDGIRNVAERLGVPADDVERVAFVYAKISDENKNSGKRKRALEDEKDEREGGSAQSKPSKHVDSRSNSKSRSKDTINLATRRRFRSDMHTISDGQ